MDFPGLPSEDRRRQVQIVFAFLAIGFGISELVAIGLRSFDTVAFLWLILGILSVGTGVYLYRGEPSAWGLAVILAALGILAGLGLDAVFVAATSAVVLAVLYLFRRTYGVGLWKIEQVRREEERKEREAKRTENPRALHCPRCGSVRLYIAEDGSAFCLDCRVGAISIVT